MKKNGMKAAFIICAAMSLSCISLSACSSTAKAAVTASAETTAAQESAEKDGSHKPDGGEHKDPLQALVESGKLSQTTYDAIQTYMKENAPERKEGESRADGQTPPEKPQGDEAGKNGQNKPDKKPDQKPDASSTADSANAQTPPEGGAGPDGKGGPGMGGMLSEELLNKMLEANVITEAEFNTIKEAMPQQPEKPAESTAAAK